MALVTGRRWIFILEGIAIVIVDLFAFALLHDFPESAKFLIKEEREFVRLKCKGHRQEYRRPTVVVCIS